MSATEIECAPHHIAIIMDGNRRWAQKRFLPPMAGHWKGAGNLKGIVRAASDMGVKVLTVFAFSTENWKRSPTERTALFDLFRLYLYKELSHMQKEGVRLRVIGHIEGLPIDLQKALTRTMKATAEGNKITLILAINYGGRDEICRATQAIAREVAEKKLDHATIDENLFRSYLDTADWPDPDLVIRTSGEMRLSNFLLWQLSYSEIFATPTLWPDFSTDDLRSAIYAYLERKRRTGA